MASTVDDFMLHPLVVWVKTVSKDGGLLSYADLIDGKYLNTVMAKINCRSSDVSISNELNREVNSRIQNLDRLLKSIRVYYQDSLEQLIVMELPRIFTIAKDPVSEEAFNEIQKLLLLMLGCAVQCELKQEFVEGIKLLDIHVQHAIVNHIQEITDNNENVCSLNWGEFVDMSMEQIDLQSRNMFSHMKRIVKERDNYSETIMELSQEKDFLQVQIEGRKSISPPMSPTANRHQMTVELAETKAKLRRTRQEMEEKAEQALEYKEELDRFGQQLHKLRQENLTLVQDARSARVYRDELDALKEQASKVDKYEIEISKYRERLNEMEYVKRRVEELRQDNQLLHETNALLQDQVETFQSKGDRVRDLEADLLRYKSQIDTLQEQRETDNDKLQEMVEENARLQMDHRQSLNESASLGHELEMAKLVSPSGNSLSKECNDSASSKIVRLERENQKLLSELQTLQESFQTDSKGKLLQKENERLCQKIEKLQVASSSEMQNFFDLETENGNLKKEKGQLEEMMQTQKEMSERQVKELENENEQLAHTIDTLRERNQKNVDHRIRDIENENRKLHEEMKESQNKLSKVEFDNKQLQKKLDTLIDNAKRLEEIEQSLSDSVRENDKLNRTVDMLNIRCDKYEELERENMVLEVQKDKLENEKHQQEKTLKDLRVHCQKLEQYEADNVQLRSRLQTLQKTLDTMKDNMSKVLELEHDKEELDRQNRQLQKSIVALKSSQERGSQLEVDYIELETQNKQLHKAIELNKLKIEKLEKENQELDNQVERLKEDLKKSSESQKLSSKMVEDLEKDNRTLELEKETIEKDKRRLDKENNRLKMSLEGKDSEIDAASSKIATLQRDIKHTQKSAEKNKEIAERVKELEVENRDLLKQSTLDKKTLATLREELVNEKIRTQQQDNDLEKLSTELDRIGLNKDKLMREELREDESRIKALQSQMEDTLNRSMEIKDEKIKSLEQRLQESTGRNQKMNEEIRLVKREYDSLQQQTIEDERSTMDGPGRASVKRTDSDKIHAKQIIQMKDHLVELERENATLLAENNNLKSQKEGFTTQTANLQTENKAYQAKIGMLQEQSSNLQSQHAKLQVEQATIGSQISTLQSENSNLQTQVSSLELDAEKSKSKLEEMEGTYDSLLSNYDQLTQLHENLNQEYESLINEHSALKSELKVAKSEFENVKEQREEMEKKKVDMLLLQSSLRQEEDSIRKMKRDKSYGTLERDHESLQHIYDRLNKEYKELEEKHNTVKGQYRTLQRDHTVLQGELHDAKDRCQQMEIESSKVAHRCELLNHLNGNLEEENKKLMEQLSQLMAQNQELLVSTLESKELHHEEQKQLVEKLNNLRRQKEKLEEKIMDQYKNHTSPQKRNKGGGFSGLLKRIHKPRNKDKSKKERKYSLGNDSMDGMVDSPGETSSVGSGGGESIEGMTIEAAKRPADHDTFMSDDDQGNQSYIRRRSNLSKASMQNRKSMPAYVHEAQRDPVLQRKEVVHSSLSSEDLRMSKDDLDSLSSSSSTKRAPAARRSSFEKALEAYPSLNLSDAFPPDTYFPDFEFGRKKGKEKKGLSAVPAKSTPNLSTLGSERAQSLDDTQSPGTERRGSRGLMSRIRSRSREILDDLKYNSASNLSKMDQSEGQMSLPIGEPFMTSTLVQPEEATSRSAVAAYTTSLNSRYSDRVDLDTMPPVSLDKHINVVSDVVYDEDPIDVVNGDFNSFRNSRHNPGYNSPTHINSPQGPSASTPRSNNLNPSVYAAIPYHKLTPTDRTTPPTITKKTPPVGHKVIHPKPRYPQNLQSPKLGGSPQESSPRDPVNIPVDPMNVSSTRSPRDRVRQPPIGRTKSNNFTSEHSHSLTRKNSLPKHVYEKPAKIYGSESNLAINSTKTTPGDGKNKGKLPTNGQEAADATDSTKDDAAKKENSIWYEYGCV